MKRLFVLAVLLFGSFVLAEYVEVKTGYGRTYYETREQPRLYVCYNKRVRVHREGMVYLRYDGCARYTYSCRSNGKARFGRYPSVRAARNALYRCKTAQPRFVD